MKPNYIARTVVLNAGTSDAKNLSESELVNIKAPLVILGDPGLGKTRLMESVAEVFAVSKISGGTFHRSENLDAFVPKNGKPIIIDGLDEIASTSGASAVDEVLRKLSKLGYPHFIISCRAADWQGSADRYKIRSDYGAEAETALLLPFTYDEAKRFISEFNNQLDAEEILNHLSSRDLNDLYGNPLTLELIANIVVEGQQLPSSRANLFETACSVLIAEQNEAHFISKASQAPSDKLLDAAGAIFAHLLLSGSIGVSSLPPSKAPNGYVAVAEFAATDVLSSATIGTRLFQSVGESLLVPFHRVLAEYLGARWLAKAMSAGLSERRVMGALTFAGGVPTPLRGLHAWLAYFNPAVADQCIKTDPYGILRYGEPERLSDKRAGLLLEALATLSKDDPYFRSEDWGRRALTGLARPQLKDQIVGLIKSSGGHTHLSTLILQSLTGSAITTVVAPELVSIVQDKTAAYVERINAAQVLIESNVSVGWKKLIHRLDKNTLDGRRLAMEIVSFLKGGDFSGEEIANIIFDFQGTFAKEEPKVRIGGVDYFLSTNLKTTRIVETLNALSARIEKAGLPRFRRIESDLATLSQRLLARLIKEKTTVKASELWAWLNTLGANQGYLSADKEVIDEFIKSNDSFRRAVQNTAFVANAEPDGPWMAIVHDLPRASPALALTNDDAIEYLRAIAAKDALSEFDVSLWAAIVRLTFNPEGMRQDLKMAIDGGAARHKRLRTQFEEITSPPKRDWRKEEAERQAKADAKRQRKFQSHRQSYLPVIEQMADGSNLGALIQAANGYLNRYSDLDSDASPVKRLHQWLGEEITEAALNGFMKVLSRNDLPSIHQLSEAHAEGKICNAEAPMTAGVLEFVRRGIPLDGIEKSVLAATLASWWEFPDHNNNNFGEEAQRQMEAALLKSESEKEQFLTAVIEPSIRANKSYVSQLHLLKGDERFRGIAGPLALKWLEDHPELLASTQEQLIGVALLLSPEDSFLALVRKRMASWDELQEDVRAVWASAAFLIDFDESFSKTPDAYRNNPNSIWMIRNAVYQDRSGSPRPIVNARHYVFIAETFATRWPSAGYPHSGWSGDQNPWDASDFIRASINAIGTLTSEEATTALDRLSESLKGTSYADHVKHVRAQQRRTKRDAEFNFPTFNEIRSTLAGGLPGSIDDLKATMLDRLHQINKYIRDSETDAWDSFWDGDEPKSENTCRNRLVDLLRARTPSEIALLPETLMPEEKRADIVAIYKEWGLPTEVKGQWHPNVWDASSVQLAAQYGRDWRAHGRGIYLVIWVGAVAGKSIRPEPDTKKRPRTPIELKEMLEARLTEAERSRIDILVIDVSQPKKDGGRTRGKSGAAKKGKSNARRRK